MSDTSSTPLPHLLRVAGQPGLPWAQVAPLAYALCATLEASSAAPLCLEELAVQAGTTLQLIPHPHLPDRSVYAAPEWEAGPPSPAARVYNAAALITHLLLGQAPFAAASPAAQRVRKLVEAPPTLPHTVPDTVQAALHAGLHPEPSARPASLAALLAAPALPAPPHALLSHRPSRRSLPLLGILLSGVLCVGGAVTVAGIGILTASSGRPPLAPAAPAPAHSETSSPTPANQSGLAEEEGEVTAEQAPSFGGRPAPIEPASPAPLADVGTRVDEGDVPEAPTASGGGRAAPTAPSSAGTPTPERSAPLAAPPPTSTSRPPAPPTSAPQTSTPPAPAPRTSGIGERWWAVAAGVGGLACVGSGLAVGALFLGFGFWQLRPRRQRSRPRLPAELPGEAAAGEPSQPTLDAFLHGDPLRAPTDAGPDGGGAVVSVDFQPFSLAGYRCTAKLGEGGMGIVYVAEHLQLGRRCAVKVLSPSAAVRKASLVWFQREAQLAARINHPNVVTVYDFGAVGTLFYLVMELIEGESLEALSLPLPPGRALDITRQLCEGLDAAHSAGVVHRDLKPANILLTRDQRGRDWVKILDFGIARPLTASDGTLAGEGLILGTPSWMSPEQARGEPNLDARSDIFTLALIVYALLTGQRAYEEEAGHTPLQVVLRRGSLRRPPPPPSRVRTGLAPQVDAALLRALSPDRSTRPRSALDFFAELSPPEPAPQ